MRRFKPYPAYKNSGVEWLGEIPAHWEAGRLKALLSLSRERNGDQPVGEMLSVSGYRGVEPREYDFEERKRSDEDLADYRVVRVGQLVVNTMWLNYAGLGVSAFEGHVSPAYRCYEIRHRYERSYLHHLMRSATYVGGYCGLLYGIRPNSLQIKNHDWDSLELLVPPREEQRAIAAFVDRETARIDALVAKKERLIELLQEKRTALITRAVTKGLAQNVPMKESGVEWLGKIPAHWEMLALKRRARRIQTGTTPPTSEAKYYEDGVIAWYGPGSFADDLALRTPVKLIAESAVVDGVARVFESGSALIVTIGTIGKVAYMERAGSCNQQITGVTFDRRVYAKYGAYELKSLEPVLRGIAPNTTLPILDQEEVGYLPYVVPPEPEQRAIAAFLDRETSKIDALVAKVREAIDRLKELRTAVISAAVTGKIDVREVEA